MTAICLFLCPCNLVSLPEPSLPSPPLPPPRFLAVTSSLIVWAPKWIDWAKSVALVCVCVCERVDEERERGRENGHELFMNASMEGGEAVGAAGGGGSGSDTARLSPGGATIVPTASLLLGQLAGKTTNTAKSEAKKNAPLSSAHLGGDARYASISVRSLGQAEAGVQRPKQHPTAEAAHRPKVQPPF